MKTAPLVITSYSIHYTKLYDVETIPFDETRHYVKKVMSNAVVYAAMMERRPQSLKARLGVIDPGP